jgi:PAS domain S-box-containing protein
LKSTEPTSTPTHFQALGAALAGNRRSAIVYARADGGIGFWNAGAEALFGHSPDEATGKRVDLIVPEEHRAMHWTGLGERSALRGKEAPPGVRSKACTRMASAFPSRSFSRPFRKGTNTLQACSVFSASRQPDDGIVCRPRGNTKPPRHGIARGAVTCHQFLGCNGLWPLGLRGKNEHSTSPAKACL